MDEVREPANLVTHLDFMDALHDDREEQSIIQQLLDQGASIGSITPKGETLLHLAIVSSHKLAQLWGAGSAVLDINARDYQGRTPLHYAMAAGSIWGASFCIDLGADINARDLNGATALHFAVQSIQCQHMMIQIGLDVSAWDHLGRTPLHYAALSWIRNELDQEQFSLEQLVMGEPLVLTRTFFTKKSYDNTSNYLCCAGADETMLDNNGSEAGSICPEDNRAFKEIGEWLHTMRTSDMSRREFFLLQIDMNLPLETCFHDFYPNGPGLTWGDVDALSLEPCR